MINNAYLSRFKSTIHFFYGVSHERLIFIIAVDILLYFILINFRGYVFSKHFED